jgi:hypothetical protein
MSGAGENRITLSHCAFYSGTEYFNASFLHCLHKLRKFLSSAEAA